MQGFKNFIQLIIVACFMLVSFIPLSRAQLGKTNASLEKSGYIDFDLLSLDPIKIEPMSIGPIKLHSEVINIGDSTDSYALFRVEDLPSHWSSALCVEGRCWRPDIDTIWTALTLNPMEMDTLSAYIYPDIIEGSGSVTLTVRSHADPNTTRSIELVAITSGTDILVVDDDEEDGYEGYYEDALGENALYGTWIRSYKEVTSEDLAHFEAVIWETGDVLPALTPADQSALAEYLDNGGNLFLSGQDIGYSLCDPASPDCSQASCDFYQNYLHAGYQSNSSDDVSLTGVFGDAISHGLEIDIAGGDGADNQTSPSVISPLGPAREVFEYDESQVGAVRVETGTYKVVYFAFGFEAISSEILRQGIMKNILNRFAYDGEKGDVDNNHTVNVLDVLSAANIILALLDPTPDQSWRADFDNNEQINVLDLIGIVNVILGGGVK